MCGCKKVREEVWGSVWSECGKVCWGVGEVKEEIWEV